VKFWGPPKAKQKSQSKEKNFLRPLKSRSKRSEKRLFRPGPSKAKAKAKAKAKK